MKVKKNITKKESEDRVIIDNEFEALAETKRVYSKTPLNSDHVMSNLKEAEKEWIMETIFNSAFAIDILKRYAKEKYLPKWNKEKMDWETNEDGSIRYFSLEELSPSAAKECNDNADKISNIFMLKVNSMALLNRNSKDNFMLKYGWFKSRDEEKVVEYTKDDRNNMERLMDKMRGEDSEYED